MSTPTLRSWCFLGILMVIIVTIIVVVIWWILCRTKKNKSTSEVIPWEPFAVNALNPFASDGVTQMFRPWLPSSTRDIAMAYHGALEFRDLPLELSVPDQRPVYWEFDIYRYPSWELVHVIPLQSRVVVGGKQYPLQPGFYAILLRTAGHVPPEMLTSRMGVRYISPGPEPSSVPTLIVNDESRYADADDLLQQITPQLYEQRYVLVSSAKSQDVEAASPYIHREHISLQLTPNQVLLLIHSGRDAMSTLSVNINGDITYPECKAGPIHHHLTVADSASTVIVNEHIYGIHPKSQFLPIYAYIFEKQ